jgi:hypothetical protein
MPGVDDKTDAPILIEDDVADTAPVGANDEQLGPGIDAGMPTDEETAARVRNAGLVDLTQSFNERVANVPREYEVGGKTVYIHSKPIGDIIRIDAEVIRLQKLVNTTVSTAEDNERLAADPDYLAEMYDRLSERQTQIWNLVRKIICGIANGPDTPKVDKLTPTDADRMTMDQANEIIEAYIHYNDIEGLLKNVTGARSF